MSSPCGRRLPAGATWRVSPSTRITRSGGRPATGVSLSARQISPCTLICPGRSGPRAVSAAFLPDEPLGAGVGGRR